MVRKTERGKLQREVGGRSTLSERGVNGEEKRGRGRCKYLHPGGLCVQTQDDACGSDDGWAIGGIALRGGLSGKKPLPSSWGIIYPERAHFIKAAQI